MLKEIQIRSTSSMDIAKYQGIMGAFIGLFVGAFYAAMAFIFSGMMNVNNAATYGNMMQDRSAMGAGGFALGIGALIFIPIFYGIMGFVGGFILSGISNRVLGFIGGVKMTILEKETN